MDTHKQKILNKGFLFVLLYQYVMLENAHFSKSIYKIYIFHLYYYFMTCHIVMTMLSVRVTELLC